jgi:hypothetical protein
MPVLLLLGHSPGSFHPTCPSKPIEAPLTHEFGKRPSSRAETNDPAGNVMGPVTVQREQNSSSV